MMHGQKNIKLKGKEVKFHPTTGHEDPEGEERYSSTLPLTSALNGVGDQRDASSALPPGETRYPLYRRQGLDRCGKSHPRRDSIPGPSSS